MYRPKPGTKQDPVRRWNLPDRAFFGHGACHILAHTFLERFRGAGYYALWIKPGTGYHGNHVFVTNDSVAFDFHGYCKLNRLVSHHFNKYIREQADWRAQIIKVTGDLSDPDQMSRIGMQVRGPTQFLYDARPRAQKFLSRYDNQHAIHVANYAPTESE